MQFYLKRKANRFTNYCLWYIPIIGSLESLNCSLRGLIGGISVFTGDWETMSFTFNGLVFAALKLIIWLSVPFFQGLYLLLNQISKPRNIISLPL